MIGPEFKRQLWQFLLKRAQLLTEGWNKRFWLALIFVLLTSALSEADCIEDGLAEVDQGILVMTSGGVYEVTNTNGVVIAFWVPSAELTICDQIDMNGNIYYSISNRDTNENVYAIRRR